MAFLTSVKGVSFFLSLGPKKYYRCKVMFCFLEGVWLGIIIYIYADHMCVGVGKIKEMCFIPATENM